MSDRKWFSLLDNKVTGPHTEEEINRIAETQPILVWGRGQTEWVAHPAWLRYLQEYTNIMNLAKMQAERQWRIRIGDQESKPMSHDQMIAFLKSKTDLSSILIWTEGYSEWKEIYQIHKVMDELGVSRRAHPRVPISGTITCEGASGTFETKLLSISEGGLGITNAAHVKIGEKFKVIIKSPNLFTPIHATVEVVYTSADGYVGMKFTSLHSESKSAIIEYVKKLAEPQISEYRQ